MIVYINLSLPQYTIVYVCCLITISMLFVCTCLRISSSSKRSTYLSFWWLDKGSSSMFLLQNAGEKTTLLRVIPTMTFIRFVTGKSSGILSGISSGIRSGILSGISSGILPGICSGISSGILSGISSDILSGKSSGILSGKHSGTLSGIPSGILSGITSGILSGITSGYVLA